MVSPVEVDVRPGGRMRWSWVVAALAAPTPALYTEDASYVDSSALLSVAGALPRPQLFTGLGGNEIFRASGPHGRGR